MEILLVVALVALLYTLLLAATVQIARTTRTGSVAAVQRLELMKISERLRWQLRCLYVPPALARAAANNATADNTNANATLPEPSRPVRSGLIGVPDLPLLGQRGQQQGRDVMLFLTSEPVNMRGVAEVGYQVREDAKKRPELVYRQFPVRDVGGFHSLSDQQEAPWTSVVKGVKTLILDYSNDGSTWQREWDEDDAPAPRRVRVAIETDWSETVHFEVTPGMGAGRW